MTPQLGSLKIGVVVTVVLVGCAFAGRAPVRPSYRTTVPKVSL